MWETLQGTGLDFTCTQKMDWEYSQCGMEDHVNDISEERLLISLNICRLGGGQLQSIPGFHNPHIFPNPCPEACIFRTFCAQTFIKFLTVCRKSGAKKHDEHLDLFGLTRSITQWIIHLWFWYFIIPNISLPLHKGGLSWLFGAWCRHLGTFHPEEIQTEKIQPTYLLIRRSCSTK